MLSTFISFIDTLKRVTALTINGTRFSAINCTFLTLLVFALMGCSTERWYPKAAAEEVREQDLGGFPYHPLVYHLDLSILSYQLYGQTLVWPFDPYYEEANNGRGNRKQTMEKVRSWAKNKGSEQLEIETGLASYRGPGVLGGFEDNESHDPIIYRYDRLHPWSPNITNALDAWTEYLVPKDITDKIRDVYMCYRETGKPIDSEVVKKVAIARNDYPSGARDILLAFEGGTGDKGIKGQPASQSLMGFVLVRFYANSNEFDIHISFRGSRSGSGSRAMYQAFSDDNSKGNPDWITDLGYNLVDAKTGAGDITQTGSVSRGMATSIRSIFPSLFQCLMKVTKLVPNTAPKRIFVTGHSLGAGLAQVFASSVLLGDEYGPEGAGRSMPGRLRDWPWKQLKLITFSAPRVGDELWAKKLSEEYLFSDFFSTAINPYDKNALKVTDPGILPSLLDANQASGFRVLIPSDPITTEKLPGGKHVGKTVYVSKPKIHEPPSFKSHQPANIRRLLSKGLNDIRIPSTSWKTWEITDLTPDYDKAKKGTPEEYKKLASSIEQYYQDKEIYFDASGFRSDFNLFMELYKSND